MAKNKRWGKEFIDKRDHKQYQNEVLKRYEIFLDLDWTKSWDKELIQMNEGKRGAKFQYPNSMIEWQALLVEKFTTRGAESISRKLENFGLIPKCNDHSTIHRRLLRLDLKFDVPKGVAIHEGTDGSGFKMTNGGEYFQDKYGKSRRKFARVIITATKDEILDVDVVVNEKGSLTEPDAGKNHITKIIEDGGIIDKSYNDGAFDTKDFFNFLEKHNIKSAIRNRSDATKKAKGSLRRKKEVIKFKELGYKEWSRITEYGMRWPMTEGHFSAIKRCYGENSRGKKTENILIELKRKVWIYNKVKKYGRL
jgi:hypothetical protein